MNERLPDMTSTEWIPKIKKTQNKSNNKKQKQN